MEGQEDTETSIMEANDEVKKLICSWIKENEVCAMEMKKLADELEIQKKSCTISKCVGSTVSVAGTLGLIGAGVLTLITGGIAAPAIPLITAVIGGGVSFGANIVESILSSETIKNVKEAEKKSDKIKEQILKLSKDLKVGGPQLTRRNSKECLIEFASHDASPQDMDSGQLNPDVKALLVTILTIFTVQSEDFSVRSLHDLERLICSIAAVALGATAKKGVMIVAGSLALALMLPEAIRDWKRLIENNHVTEVSQSVRNKAEISLTICQTLKDQFGGSLGSEQ